MALLNPRSVLVTGANGFLGLHIVNQLLQDGFMVHGTVRSEKAAQVVRSCFPGHFETQLKISYVKDITSPESYRDVFDDTITECIHVASPCPGATQVEDNVRDMLHPAITGATAILSAVKAYASPNFGRVVQISSLAAMLDIKKGLRPGYVYDESDWNPVTFEEAAMETSPVALYLASKALAEKAVWKWESEHKPNFDIVCLCPSMIFGPHIEDIGSLSSLRATTSLLWSLVDATCIPQLDFAGVADVRDVALMAAAALKRPEAGGQRFLVAQHFDWQSAADSIRAYLDGEDKDRIPVGKPGTGREAALERLYGVDGLKAVKVLLVEYRPLSDTVNDTLKQFFSIEKKEKAGSG